MTKPNTPDQANDIPSLESILDELIEHHGGPDRMFTSCGVLGINSCARPRRSNRFCAGHKRLRSELQLRLAHRKSPRLTA